MKKEKKSISEDTTSEKLSDTAITELIESTQADLRCYILSLMGNNESFQDVLQETLLFLWQQREQFEKGTNFKAWAFRTAYYKVKAAKRDHAKKEEVFFSDAMAETISNHASNFLKKSSKREQALKKCLAALPIKEKYIIKIKYEQNQNLTDYAALTGQSKGSIYQQISRARKALKKCIQHKLSQSA